jgi:hypothetical protein
MKINNKYLAVSIVYSVVSKFLTIPNVVLSLRTEPVTILTDFFATLLITYGLLVVVVRFVNSRRKVVE